jgi:alkylation response protein AidB-like acyl-CoA dehydrogenase
VDFALTDEQELLRSTARTLLAAECPPSLVRSTEEHPAAVDPLWRHLGEWVVLGDGPLVDLALFVEEAGAVCLPGPFLPTTALFVPLLRACGHPDADAAAAGELTGTVALAGTSGEWVLSGDPVRTFVLEADHVDRVAVVLPGPSVAVLEAPAGLRRVGTLDWSRRVFELPVPSGLEGDALPLADDALATVLERATVAAAAELVGTTRWIVDATVAYAKERVQFGVPIGSFQAVQHKLADMALDLERARAAVQYAAMTVDAEDPDRHRAVHVAKAAAGAAAQRAVTDGIQLHGGIGYTWEHDLHLFLRRALLAETLLGTTTWHHDRLADLLLT